MAASRPRSSSTCLNATSSRSFDGSASRNRSADRRLPPLRPSVAYASINFSATSGRYAAFCSSTRFQFAMAASTSPAAASTSPARIVARTLSGFAASATFNSARASSGFLRCSASCASSQWKCAISLCERRRAHLFDALGRRDRLRPVLLDLVDGQERALRTERVFAGSSSERNVSSARSSRPAFRKSCPSSYSA